MAYETPTAGGIPAHGALVVPVTSKSKEVSDPIPVALKLVELARDLLSAITSMWKLLVVFPHGTWVPLDAHCVWMRLP